MITLHPPRSQVEAVQHYFYPIINMYKHSRLVTASYHGPTSEQYLFAQTISCLLAEIEITLQKKLITTTGKKIKLDLSDAQGIVLYRTLLAIPLPPENIYMQMIRNEWVQWLDLQLNQQNLLPAQK